MTNIEQIWYTWSTVGLDNIRAGYRVRAASPGIRNLQDIRYVGIAKYLQYQLPEGTDPNALSPTQAPLNLTFAKTEYGTLLVSKKYLGPDGIGRAGNYFAHLLVGLPEEFTAGDAILLWKSPFWQTVDLPQKPTLLASLTLEELSTVEHLPIAFDFKQLSEHLLFLLKAFLASAIQRHLYIAGNSQEIAMLIWGLTRALPPSLVSKITFSTYESDIGRCRETIVGVPSTSILPPACYQDGNIVLNCAAPPPRIEVDAAMEEQASEALLHFRTRCLSEQPTEQPPAREEPPSAPERPSSLVVSPPQDRPVIGPPDAPWIDSPLVVDPSSSDPGPLPLARLRLSGFSQTAGRRLRSILAASLVINLVLLILSISLIGSARNSLANTPGGVAQTTTVSSSLTATTPPIIQRSITPQPYPPGNLEAYDYAFIGVVASDGKETAITAPANTPFTILIAVKNTGLNTWSGEQYVLKCTDSTDPDCNGGASRGSESFTGSPVSTGQFYVFLFQLKSPNHGSRSIRLQMFHSGLAIGHAFQVYFTLT